MLNSHFRKVPMKPISLRKESQIPFSHQSANVRSIRKARLYLYNVIEQEIKDLELHTRFTYSTLCHQAINFMEDKAPAIDLMSIPGYRRPRKYETSFNVFESIASERKQTA
jgi:hypothetical protein